MRKQQNFEKILECRYDEHSEYQPILLCNKDHECHGKNHFFKGSDGEVVRVFDSHFNVSGFNSGFVIVIFLKDFIISTALAPSGPLSGESTFHYHQFKK
jgi:hypothetical protein